MDVCSFIINFYRDRLGYYKNIGIGSETFLGTTVTKELIKCTENRLDQLVTGKKTAENTGNIEKVTWRLKQGNLNQLCNSNRSFCGSVTSKFQIRDLEPIQQRIIYDYFDYGIDSPYEEPHYIDKISTAYNSEIMQDILSHNS